MLGDVSEEDLFPTFTFLPQLSEVVCEQRNKAWDMFRCSRCVSMQGEQRTDGNCRVSLLVSMHWVAVDRLVTRVMHWWPLWGEARADPQETKPAPMKPLQDPAEPTTHCPCENIFKKGQKLWTSRAVNTQVREEGEEEVLQVPRQSFACRPWRGPWLIRLSLCCPW